MLKFGRRKLMHWAAGSALGSALLGGFLGRRASAQQAVPFVDLALAGVTVATPEGTGLWLMDQMGKIHTRGSAPVFDDASIIPCVRPSPYVAMAHMPAGSPAGEGVIALTMDGQFRAFGSFDPKMLQYALERTSPLPVRHLPYVAFAVTPDGWGAWALDLMGRLSTFGSAPVFDDASIIPCVRPSPYVAMVPTPTGDGLYALTQSGQLRTFGETNKDFDTAADPNHIIPCVDLAIPSDGLGLWEIDLLGNLHTLGGAPVLGSPPEPNRTPYVAMIPTPSGEGLYALTMDGTLRLSGDALDFSAPLP